MRSKFACDTCGGALGYVDLETVTAPIHAGHFTSLMPERRIPEPFHKGSNWTQCMCVRCRHRAFQKPDEITLVDDHGKKKRINVDKLRAVENTRQANQAKINEMFGEEIIERPTPFAKFQEAIINAVKGRRSKDFTCEQCGKSYKHQSSLIRHNKDAHGK